MEEILKPGITGEAKVIVDEKNTATAYESGNLPVFATPAMIALMEKAAALSVKPYLPEESTTVGTKVNVSHIAATVEQMEVTAKSELIEIDGKRLVFKVEAYDNIEKIGEGFHERFIINSAKFMAKNTGKASRK